MRLKFCQIMCQERPPSPPPKTSLLSALVKGHSTISFLLEKISEADSENVKTRTEFRGLVKEMKNLETGFMAGLWHSDPGTHEYYKQNASGSKTLVMKPAERLHKQCSLSAGFVTRVHFNTALTI